MVINIPYLDELNPSDKVEYLYYSDLINYIAKNDTSQHAKKLLKKTRHYFELVRNKYDIQENFQLIKNELQLYYADTFIKNGNENMRIKTIIVESTDYTFENGKTYRSGGKDLKYANISDPNKYRSQPNDITLEDLL